MEKNTRIIEQAQTHNCSLHYHITISKEKILNSSNSENMMISYSKLIVQENLSTILPDNMSLIIFSIQSLKTQYIMYMICTRVSSTTACIHIQHCILFIQTHMYLCTYDNLSSIFQLRCKIYGKGRGKMTRQDL